jgi:hypothetical protein
MFFFLSNSLAQIVEITGIDYSSGRHEGNTGLQTIMKHSCQFVATLDAFFAKNQSMPLSSHERQIFAINVVNRCQL